MNRWMYRAQIKTGQGSYFRKVLERVSEEWQAALIQQGAVTCSLFAYEDMLFVYIEAPFESTEWKWPAECQDLLDAWPDRNGPTYQVLMPDVFHDGVVHEIQNVREQRRTEVRTGSLARLKPEMYSSYIYYHYQLQEEQRGSFNQTYMIGTNELYIFSYWELPTMKDDIKRPGLLTTNHTPTNWHEVMAPHFITWPNTDEQIWSKMEMWFSF
ncbi:hypothetical protein D3C73_723330 [compost metagenome]